MPGDPVESFPPLVQYLIYAVGGAAWLMAWLVGGRKRNGADHREEERLGAIRREDDRLAVIERELDSRKERDRTDRDLADLRKQIEDGMRQDLAEMQKDIEEGLQKVVAALRTTIEGQIKELRQQIGRLSRKNPRGM